MEVGGLTVAESKDPLFMISYAYNASIGQLTINWDVSCLRSQCISALLTGVSGHNRVDLHFGRHRGMGYLLSCKRD